jgi:hypothetical protein
MSDRDRDARPSHERVGIRDLLRMMNKAVADGESPETIAKIEKVLDDELGLPRNMPEVYRILKRVEDQ